MRPIRALAPVSLSLLVAACASSTPAPVAPPPAASSAPVASIAAPPPDVPDLSPAQEPRLLLGVARWKAPTKNIDAAMKSLGATGSLSEEIERLGHDAAKVISWDSSFDAALAIDPASPDDAPSPLFAVSIPVVGFDAARAASEAKHGAARPLRGGAVRLVGTKGVCVLSPANGDAPARVVCGGSERDVEALRPWLTRTLAATPPASGDLEAEFRMKPVKERYLPFLRVVGERSGGEAREQLARMQIGDPELLDAPAKLIDEGLRLLEDLDRVEVKSAIGTAGPTYKLSGSVKFSSNTSWFTTYLTSPTAPPSAPPEPFWHLPKDAFAASWGRTAPRELLATPRRVLSKAVSEGLARAPLGDADKKAVQGFVDHIPEQGTFAVSASSFSGKAPKGADLKTSIESFAQSWSVTGIDVPADGWVKWLREGATAANRVMAFARSKDKKGKDTAALPTVTFSANAAGFPRGSALLEVDATKLLAMRYGPMAMPPAVGGLPDPWAKGGKPGAAAKAMTPRKYYLVVVPDGAAFTWIGFGQDLAELKKAVGAAHSSGKKDGTLAARGDLDALKVSGHTGGAFIALPRTTIPGLLDVVRSEAPKPVLAAVEKLYATAPNKLTTPQLLFFYGEAGPTPSIGVRLEVQKGTFEDLVALVNFARTPEGREVLRQLKK